MYSRTNDAPVVDLNGGGFGVDMAVGVTEASELPSDADAHYDTIDGINFQGDPKYGPKGAGTHIWPKIDPKYEAK